MDVLVATQTNGSGQPVILLRSKSRQNGLLDLNLNLGRNVLQILWFSEANCTNRFLHGIENINLKYRADPPIIDFYFSFKLHFFETLKKSLKFLKNSQKYKFISPSYPKVRFLFPPPSGFFEE